jgi:hypothetical protein
MIASKATHPMRRGESYRFSAAWILEVNRFGSSGVGWKDDMACDSPGEATSSFNTGKGIQAMVGETKDFKQRWYGLANGFVPPMLQSVIMRSVPGLTVAQHSSNPLERIT